MPLLIRVRYSAFVSIIFLTSCTGIGGTAVKENYSKMTQYEIDMNWQEAFRILKDQSIGCWQGGGGWSGTSMVNAQLYNELGIAEIQINNGNLGTYLYIEIFKTESLTKVHGYSAIRTWNKTLDMIAPKMVDGQQTFNFEC